jgi:cytochrome c oxidase accessory protein FixG
MKLAAGPWNRKKIIKKGTKHAAWILFSLWTGFTFVGYVTPIRELTLEVFQGRLGPWEIFWILFYAFATYGNAGWLREQVCLYMCPYARFQGAMFDRDTLVISYDEKRGEARGSRKRGDDYQTRGLGDCVDCTLCVQVCPTGIDIRNGLQIGCIACAACVDVCDSVMQKMNYAPGLIRYTTQNEMERGGTRRVWRPRVVIYSIVLATLTLTLLAAVWWRVPVALDVLRDRNSLFRETQDGWVENVYTLKIMNMDSVTHRYRVSADGIAGLVVAQDQDKIEAKTGEVVEVPLRLSVDPANLTARSQTVRVAIEALDNPRVRVEEETRFLGPGTGR